MQVPGRSYTTNNSFHNGAKVRIFSIFEADENDIQENAPLPLPGQRGFFLLFILATDVLLFA